MCDKYDPMVGELMFECWFCAEGTYMCMNFTSPFYHIKCPSKGKRPEPITFTGKVSSSGATF